MARVLIGYSCCGLTKQAFARRGHEVWTCDLLPPRHDGLHLQCDVWRALEQEWDMAVLHPMCTYLTCSAAWAFGDGPYHQKVKPGTLVGVERRAAREEALENFKRLLDLPFPVAIENPAVSFVNKAIRPPNQVIQPYQFGDDASKATGLWLTGGLPALEMTKYVQPRLVCPNGHHNAYDDYSYCEICGSEILRPRWANQTDSGQNRLSPSADRWLERSKTYPGIAAAMGDQWGRWLTCSANKEIQPWVNWYSPGAPEKV
ncbi:MAG: hypothetical protein [Caudoviricetes sp.]|nr:MAG: hypothetical protein [Caudoviricetes sp.]